MLKKRLDKLSEEDFAVLKGPLESGRQSPESLAGNLLIAPFLIGVLLLIANMFVFVDRIEPAHPVVIILCLLYDGMALILILLSLQFGVKKVYKNRQSTQYLIVILLSQFMFGGSGYWIGMYMIFDSQQFHHSIAVGNLKLVIFIISSLVVGVILFIFSFIRFLKKLEEGKFRKNTKRDKIRSQLEENTMNFEKFAIVFGVSFTLIITSLFTMLGVHDIEVLFVASIGVTLFYVMQFILPEQIVIWYCIRRFKSYRL